MMAWSPLASVLVAPAIVWLTNRAKKTGLNPYVALACVSVFGSLVWLSAVGYYGEDVIREWFAFAIQVGGTASLIYSATKKLKK